VVPARFPQSRELGAILANLSRLSKVASRKRINLLFGGDGGACLSADVEK
jgi:hypothetical protein